jgi:hypothetical protein
MDVLYSYVERYRVRLTLETNLSLSSNTTFCVKTSVRIPHYHFGWITSEKNHCWNTSFYDNHAVVLPHQRPFPSQLLTISTIPHSIALLLKPNETSMASKKSKKAHPPPRLVSTRRTRAAAAAAAHPDLPPNATGPDPLPPPNATGPDSPSLNASATPPAVHANAITEDEHNIIGADAITETEQNVVDFGNDDEVVSTNI